LKFIKELAYQCLILAAVLGLVFVAADLSSPAASIFDKIDEQTAVKVFSPFSNLLENTDDTPAEAAKANIQYLKNVLLPFLIYLTACGGFIFLIMENIRLWKSMNQLSGANKLILTIWIIVLGLMCLLPVYLGTSMINVGLWYIFIVAAILLLFYWVYWASKER
jgi:hypothetical protein